MQAQQSGYAMQAGSPSASWSQQPQQPQPRQQLQQQQVNSQRLAKAELAALVQQLTSQQREHLSKMAPDKRMQFFHNLRNQMARAQQHQMQQQQQHMSQQGSCQQPSGPMQQPGSSVQPQVCPTHRLCWTYKSFACSALLHAFQLHLSPLLLLKHTYAPMIGIPPLSRMSCLLQHSDSHPHCCVSYVIIELQTCSGQNCCQSRGGSK